MERHRSERLSEAIREELEEIISYEMGDPRIEAEGVTEVLISPDARNARVRLALTGDSARQQETLDALNGARNYLRRELGRRLDVFRIPELHFESALPGELGGRINHLMKRIRKGRPKDLPAADSGLRDSSGHTGVRPETSEKNKVS